ncbi:serine/threonine-protein kinase [Desulfosudis oleivorans]|uniref:Serine/threonine protein kinase with TPR repeats n=1 Tax=Desulfosudis oleivorans (strain DSM 6200 / JCM 39069 / Hxd3) TaxID=96561 RepID=A8ZZY2_DESOH|nr:serine/threonine-protein kinase [Desulfosudis oleivorans]ABW67382.1 serine/threonine protein kinase with TPR repeats [Desulfosudis oleivorans Hxd3]
MVARIGPYRVLNLLCETKLSRLYKVFDQRHNRVAILKLALADNAKEESAALTLRKEAGLLSRLSHPGIISLYDHGEHDHQPYLVAEFVEGHSLIMERRERPDMGRVLSVVMAVARALAYLHQHNILHLDVKPENILIDGRRTPPMPKLCDFGMALVIEKNAPPPPPHRRIGGTAVYMAPEHALGRALDGRTDLYSLGVVLFELLTEEKPFYGITPTATAIMHVQAQPPPPRLYNPEIPPALEAIVLKAIAKNPDHRFSGLEHFIAALAPIASRMQARPPEPPVMDAGTLTRADAEKFLRAGRPDRAIAVYRDMLTRNPADFQCHHRLGGILYRQGRFQAAIRHLQAAIAVNNQQAELHKDLGRALSRTGQNENAVAAFQKALALNPDNLSILLDLGRQYNRQKQPEAAEPYFARALAAHPTSLAAYNGLAHTKQVLGKTAEAITLFQKALALAPDQPELHYNLGTAHLAIQETAAAESCFAAALRLKPGFAAAHHAMGNICLAAKNPVQAAVHLKAALAADGSGVSALYDLGRACRMQNDLDGAVSAFGRYLKFAAKDTTAYLALAEVLEAQGKQEAAGKYRRMAEELNAHSSSGQTHKTDP